MLGKPTGWLISMPNMPSHHMLTLRAVDPRLYNHWRTTKISPGKAATDAWNHLMTTISQHHLQLELLLLTCQAGPRWRDGPS